MGDICISAVLRSPGRIAFSSKRRSHLFTRTYLAYVDDHGSVYKALLLPQKDPRFYDSCLWAFSVPELVTDRVLASTEAIGKAVRTDRQISIQMPITMATPREGASPTQDESWHQSSSR
jgi:hypothetical protein